MYPTYIEQNINKILSVARIFAILSVIIAHARNAGLATVSTITERLGSIGVVLFFLFPVIILIQKEVKE